MKSFFYFFTLAVTAVLVFSGCPGPEPIERPFASLPNNFKAYCFFQEGSHWIYQNDSLANFQDSAYVSSSTCTNQYDVDKVEFDYENCFYEMVYLGQPWTLDLYPIPGTAAGGPYLFVLRESKEPGFQEEAYHFFQDDSGLDSMRIGDEHTFITERLDSMEVAGITYLNVVHVSHDAQTFGNPIKEIYWAPNVGIIKRVHWDNQSWSLLRHLTLQ